jgi:hypothetical protein
MITTGSIALGAVGAVFSAVAGDLGKKVAVAIPERLKRLKAVREVFRSPEQVLLPSFLTKALQDVEIVVGSHFGELTEPVAALLSDFRDCDLPLRMVEARLIGVEAPGALAAFEELFVLHFPDRPSACAARDPKSRFVPGGSI